MSRIIVLDSGPLGALCNTRASPTTLACNQWLESLLSAGCEIAIPEIIDYEVRREMLRLNRQKNVARPNKMAVQFHYWPLTTVAMRQVADFWARTRKQGQPTSSPDALDADVILAAQVITAGYDDCVVATSNPGHLARFVAADLWQNISE